MRQVSWIGAAVCATAVLSASASRSLAQNGEYVEYQNTATPRELEQRLDAYETELQRLRAEIDANNQLVSTEQTEPKAGAAGDDGSGLKEIPLNSAVTYKIIGRIHYDEILREGIDAFIDSGVETGEFGFDTARIGVEGTVWENAKYKIELEFEGNETDYKDVYMAFDTAWLGEFKVGHYKMPMGLEELTSANYRSFMESAPATTAFVPSRRWGYTSNIVPFECTNTLLQYGIFHEDSDDGPPGNQGSIEEGNGDISFIARGVWLPFYDEPSEGRYLTHIGGSYTYRNTAKSTFAFADKPQLGTEGTYLNAALDTDTAVEDNWQQLGAEFAWVNGPLFVAAEAFGAYIREDINYNGAFIETGYFLTGEHRGYKTSSMAWDKVKPFTNFFSVRTQDGVCRGSGALEVVARYSYLDLDDPNDRPFLAADAVTGELNSFGFGINWYLNSNMRIMGNYVYNDVARSITDGNLADADNYGSGLRFQVNW